MVETYIYLTGLPCGVNEVVAPCPDGAYTVYINERLGDQQRVEAFNHAVKHIIENDFEKSNVGEVEIDAHKK